MSFIVNSKLCNTCVFGAHSPITPERFAELQKHWSEYNQAQLCHHDFEGTNVGCRGHLEAARRGTEHHPVFVLGSEMMPGADNDTILTVLIRLGLCHFSTVARL